MQRFACVDKDGFRSTGIAEQMRWDAAAAAAFGLGKRIPSSFRRVVMATRDAA
jgi:hypothetical protein